MKNNFISVNKALENRLYRNHSIPQVTPIQPSLGIKKAVRSGISGIFALLGMAQLNCTGRIGEVDGTFSRKDRNEDTNDQQNSSSPPESPATDIRIKFPEALPDTSTDKLLFGAFRSYHDAALFPMECGDVKKGFISPFGLREKATLDWDFQFHRGIDGIPRKTEKDKACENLSEYKIYSSLPGKIYKIVRDTNESDNVHTLSGNTVILEHQVPEAGQFTFQNLEVTSFFTRYRHLSSISDDLSEGSTIEKGAFLGYMGNTGNENSIEHLHFEVSVGKCNLESQRNNDRCKDTGIDPEINPFVLFVPKDLPAVDLKFGTYEDGEYRFQYSTPYPNLALNTIKFSFYDKDLNIIPAGTKEINFNTRQGLIYDGSYVNKKFNESQAIFIQDKQEPFIRPTGHAGSGSTELFYQMIVPESHVAQSPEPKWIVVCTGDIRGEVTACAEKEL